MLPAVIHLDEGQIVYYHEHDMELKCTKGYYFRDEFSDPIGPYDTEEAAIKNMELYYKKE